MSGYVPVFFITKNFVQRDSYSGGFGYF